MGQVNLSLEEYDELKKKAEGTQELNKCFSLKKAYDGEIRLNISITKAQEIFKLLFDESRFANGEYEINEEESSYDTDIVSYYINATKVEVQEDIEETTEGEE